nr:MAG TPA: putative YnfE-like protein [Caudoviricetes sp.]
MSSPSIIWVVPSTQILRDQFVTSTVKCAS